MNRETVMKAARVARHFLTWFMVAFGALVVSFAITRCDRGLREIERAQKAKDEAFAARVREGRARHSLALEQIQQNAYAYGFSPTVTVIWAAGHEFRATKLRGVDVLVCEDGSLYTVPEPKEDSCKTSMP